MLYTVLHNLIWFNNILIMKSVKETVLRIHTELMHQQGISQESTEELEIRPRNGITSSTIVSFLLDLEDELDIQLDRYLPEIRVCKTIGAFIKIIEKACSEQGK